MPHFAGVIQVIEEHPGPRVGPIEGNGQVSVEGLRPGFEDHKGCSEPFRKFSILLDSSTTSGILF